MLSALHLAPLCLAFSIISPCVLHQNALYFAPKRTVFSTKMQCIQRQNAVYLAANSPKSGANGGVLNKNSFHRIHKLPPFYIKTNLRENRFFATR